MARKTPTVWVTSWGAASRAEVQLPDQSERGIRLESEAWWAWLELPNTRSFAYPIYDSQVGYIRGFMTVRKERRARGQQYWVAYHRTGRRLRKIYLGRAAQLTQQQLGATAERFLAMDEAAARGGMDGQKEVILGADRRRVVGAGGDDASREVESPDGTAWPTMTRVVQLGRPWVAHYGRR